MKHHSRLTMLLIDDCAEVRQLYRYCLQQDSLYTYEIVEFETISEGIAWCQQQTPDVILLDYLLPDGDGLEFLEELSKYQSISQCVVIMLTGQGDETIAVRAMKSGVQDYLCKSDITPEILQATIHHGMERLHLTRQLQQSQQQQQLMAAIALRIHQSLELEEILAVTTTQVQQFLQADRVLVFQFHPDMSGSVVAESVLPGWTQALAAQIQDNCFQKGAGADYHQGKKRAIDDIYQANLTECHLKLLEQFQVRANLVVPILVTKKLWGLLIAHQCTAPRHWQSFELDLLDQLAVQIAIAIQQANAYEQAQIELQHRKRVEASLRENEERLILALDAARMGNWDWNIQTGEIHWSTNLEKLFGIEPGTFEGRYEIFVTMIHRDDRPQVLQAINRAINEREDYNIEFRFIKPDGSLRWALSRGKVSYDQNGHPLRMSGVDIDITERKQGEAAFKASEDRFQAFMNNSPSASWITDDHGQILYLSETYLRTFQLPFDQVEDFIGKTAFDIYPAEIAQQFVDNIRQVAQTQQTLEVIEQAPRPDGTIGYFLVYKFPLPGTHGLLLVGGVAVDITEKLLAERALQQLNQELEARVTERTAALQESEERWHLALRGSNDGIWDRNIKTNEVFFSARWAEMLGYTDDELSKNRESWSSRIHPDDYDRIFKAVADHLARKTPFFQEEYRVQCKDCSYIWILDRGQALWDESGNAIRMSGSATDITQRKQTEAELLAVTRLQQAILSSIDYAIISTNSQGIIQTFNLAAQKMLGYTADEVIGKLTPNTFHEPEELKQRMDALSAYLGREVSAGDLSMVETLQHQEVEWTFIRKDGSRFPVALSVKPMCNQEGETIGGVGIAKDITHQKQIETQLRKNAASLTAAQRIAHLGSWELDLQTQKLIWSEEVFCIFRRNPESGTPSYQEMLNSIHPDDRDRREVVLQQAITQRQAYKIEYRFYRDDGSLGYLLSRGEVILDTAGKPTQIIGTILDITKRKETEEQLRNLSDRLTLALKSANIAAWDWDMIHEVEWDDRMYELYGLQSSDGIALYQDWVNRLHPDDRELAIRSTQDAVQGVKEFDTEFRIVLDDGSIRFIKASAIVQRNEQGEPQRMVGINYDITEYKQALEQIQRSLDEKETLLKEIHHRVKNNLQIISSLLRMQSRRSLDETISLLFQESQNRVQSMALIHEQLYQSADLHQINFGDYIKSLTDNLFRCYGVSQKNIRRNIETNNIKLTLDHAIPCGLIINELVSNCLKYAFPEQKEGNITISMEQYSENQLILVVKDNGIGIPETLDWENTDSLGLRIVKNLVRQLKGSIILERDRGTAFYIQFPQ